MEYFQTKLLAHGCAFVKAGTKVLMKKRLGKILASLHNALEKPSPKWDDVWTNKMTATQERELIENVKALESMPMWFKYRSTIVKPGEEEEAKNSCDCIYELIGKFGATLESGEGWML